MFFQLDSKGVQVYKSFGYCRALSNEYFKLVFTCKIRFRYSRERASQSLPKIAKRLVEKK